MAANLGAHLDPRENGADNARIISAMDPPHDRRRAPPLPPRTTPFSGRTRRVGALLHSSEIVTERLRPLRRQGKPTFRSDPPCKQKQTTPEDFQQLPMTIKYLPQQHEIRTIEMKHTPEGHYIKTTAKQYLLYRPDPRMLIPSPIAALPPLSSIARRCRCRCPHL